MVFRKTERDGEVIIDHRESPGFTEREAVAAGRTCLINGPKLFKAATYTCSHCDKIVVKNPLRTRNRSECTQCDRPICDDCAVALKLTSECQCRSRRIDEHVKRHSQSRSQIVTP